MKLSTKAFILSPKYGTVGLTYVIAPEGQAVAQAPQPIHKCGLTLTRPLPDSNTELIACVEQISMQAEHPT